MKKVIAFTTVGKDGDARNPVDLKRILRKRDVSSAIATGKQVHNVKLVRVPKLAKAKEYPGIDGFLTDVPGQPIGVFTADCAPIFLSAPSRGVVGLLHAGWRGVHGGILSKAIQLLRRQWRCSPKDVEMWTGPCIGPCCFEVKWDVARHFPATRRRRKDRWTIDLPKELQREAGRLGVRKFRINPACTMHQTTYHSFRRDQTEERQISVIYRIS